MIDSNNLISLFRKYGFDYKKSSSGKGFYAFTFKSGFFHNAEIVYVEGFDEDGLEKSIKELNDIGFSTKKHFLKILMMLRRFCLMVFLMLMNGSSE